MSATAPLLARLAQWSRLGWYDFAYSYRPSILGPLWQTATVGMWALGLVVIFGPIYANESNFVPYLIVGLTIWNFISSCITQGAGVFTGSRGLILNLKTPWMLHVIRLWSNLIYKMLFQFLIFLPMIYWFKLPLGIDTVGALAGLVTISLFGISVITLTGIVTAYFRDLQHLLGVIVRFLFFLTPVFWIPMEGHYKAKWVFFNPFYYMINVVRAPLLGDEPLALGWPILLGSLLIVSLAAWLAFRASARKLAIWI